MSKTPEIPPSVIPSKVVIPANAGSQCPREGKEPSDIWRRITVPGTRNTYITLPLLLPLLTRQKNVPATLFGALVHPALGAGGNGVRPRAEGGQTLLGAEADAEGLPFDVPHADLLTADVEAQFLIVSLLGVGEFVAF